MAARSEPVAGVTRVQAVYTPPERRTPRIRLLPLGDPEYFPIGVKHRYTRH